MVDQTSPFVLAVDGGGSVCRVAAVGEDFRVLKETGPANVSSDFDGAVRELEAGLKAVAKDLDREVSTLRAMPAFIGVAGAISPDIAEQLRHALGLTNARIDDDRPAAVRGALGSEDGVVAHCGTGSFIAAQFDGEMRFIGGWGPDLGDEASAYWVARRALSRALGVADGRAPDSGLSTSLLKKFEGSAGIVRFVANAAATDVAQLSKEVTRFAAEGDENAKAVMLAGAHEIAKGARAIGWRAELPLCLTGGIGPHFEPYLPTNMRSCIAKPKGTPLDGAIALAQDVALSD